MKLPSHFYPSQSSQFFLKVGTPDVEVLQTELDTLQLALKEMKADRDFVSQAELVLELKIQITQCSRGQQQHLLHYSGVMLQGYQVNITFLSQKQVS